MLADTPTCPNPRLHACCMHAGAGADMQWCTEDGTEGLLELACQHGHIHTLPLLISMGVGWRAPPTKIVPRKDVRQVMLWCSVHADACHNPSSVAAGPAIAAWFWPPH
jgi:hypothetical protein